MSQQDWHAFDAAVRGRVKELALDLLGKPVLRGGHEWRWGRKGSLAVVVSGAKAGLWIDHESAQGGGFSDLVARELGLQRRAATNWIADRIGVDAPGRRAQRAASATSPPPTSVATKAPAKATPESARPVRPDQKASAARAAQIWTNAQPAPSSHPYLIAKQAAPLALRVDRGGRLLVPLQDPDGRLHSLQTIAPDGAKRFLPGGAKRGHFAVVGADVAPIAATGQPWLLCEGWATGASLHLATGHRVIAAMDAGNLLPVAEALRHRFADIDLVIVADNDTKPDRTTNPGVAAARKAALAVDARLAVPPVPGDANDLFCAQGAEALAALVAGAAQIPPTPPTYPAPALTPDEARAVLTTAIDDFTAAIPAYWAAVDAADNAAKAAKTSRDPLDFNTVSPNATPPRLALPVDVGLGKSSCARAAIARLIIAGGLGGRKVVYAVPRHDLGAEQVAAFDALGLRAMLWKGRTAPDPTPANAEQLMCLDPQATFDALEIEHPVEQSCCKVKRGDTVHFCEYYEQCSYQGQKPLARAAEIVVCAHDSLFHMKPDAIGKVGLLVIDEGFWQSGLCGLDGKATLTQDGLEPGRASVVCYTRKGKQDVGATADLIDARSRLCRALAATEPGPLRLGLLQSVGLTPDLCRNAATLERSRLRDAGLLPGMAAVERRARIKAVLPPQGAPWAPPGRCATLWLILAEALECGHDAAGAELIHERTNAGSVRALRLRWRSPLRTGWTDRVPILHLDATMQPALVQAYLPRIDIRAPVTARQPHARVRQITGSPTSARALVPGSDAPERDRTTAANHLRDLRAFIALRALECAFSAPPHLECAFSAPRDREHRHHSDSQSTDVLVVGQKETVTALRLAGLPPRVEAVHFNALSGLDRWGNIGCMIVLGRTLPAPCTVERITTALTGRVPAPNPEAAGWWYPMVERHLRLPDGRTAPLSVEAHTDPVAEAVRWSICEGELIQAIGRGRGVNRTADTVIEIDLLSDVVLPVTVHKLVPWAAFKPSRQDLMALSGIVLDNAADRATCFPDLWPTHEAARKDGQRSGTNCYYNSLYNSSLSHSSALVRYRPAGPGHRTRQAWVDLARIPDPEAWLTSRLGALAQCAVEPAGGNAD